MSHSQFLQVARALSNQPHRCCFATKPDCMVGKDRKNSVAPLYLSSQSLSQSTSLALPHAHAHTHTHIFCVCALPIFPVSDGASSTRQSSTLYSNRHNLCYFLLHTNCGFRYLSNERSAISVFEINNFGLSQQLNLRSGIRCFVFVSVSFGGDEFEARKVFRFRRKKTEKFRRATNQPRLT